MCVRNERTAMYERNQGRSGCVSSPRHRRCPAPDARRACAFYFQAKARFEFVVTFPIHPFNMSPPPFVALHVSYTNECFVFNSVACFLFAVLHPQLLRSQSLSLPRYPFRCVRAPDAFVPRLSFIVAPSVGLRCGLCARDWRRIGGGATLAWSKSMV